MLGVLEVLGVIEVLGVLGMLGVLGDRKDARFSGAALGGRVSCSHNYPGRCLTWAGKPAGTPTVAHV